LSHENRSQDGQEVNSRNPSVEGIPCEFQDECGLGQSCCNKPGGGGGTCWFASSCVVYCKKDYECGLIGTCKNGICDFNPFHHYTGSDLDPRSSSSSTTTEAPSTDDSNSHATTRSSSSSTTTEAPSTENSDDSSYDATTRSSSSSTTDAPSSSTYGNHSIQSDYSSASDSTTQNLGFDFQTQNDGPRALII
jgi:hypothetical protein